MPFDKINAIGQGCHLVQTSDKRVLVQSRNQGPMMMKGRFTGRGPFDVIDGHGLPDRVICGAGVSEEEAALDAEIPPFYFALRADWSYVDTDTPANNVDTVDAYPFWLNQLGEIPAPITWKGFSGKGTPIEPPAIEDSPYSVADVPASQVISLLPYNGGTSTVHTLNTLYFYRAALTAPFDDQSTFVSLAHPDNTATPATAGDVLTGGNWQVKFDVYQIVNDTTETFVDTKTVGLFSVPDSAISTDFTTWAVANPALEWTSQEVAGDTIEYRIKNLRIEQVT